MILASTGLMPNVSPIFVKSALFGCDKPFRHILTPLYLQQHKMMSVHFFIQSIRKLTR